MTDKDWCKVVGLGRSNLYYHLSQMREGGEGEMPYALLVPILRHYPQLEPSWAAMGKGRMYRESYQRLASLAGVAIGHPVESPWSGSILKEKSPTELSAIGASGNDDIAVPAHQGARVSLVEYSIDLLDGMAVVTRDIGQLIVDSSHVESARGRIYGVVVKTRARGLGLELGDYVVMQECRGKSVQSDAIYLMRVEESIVFRHLEPSVGGIVKMSSKVSGTQAVDLAPSDDYELLGMVLVRITQMSIPSESPLA